jgi:hypothetical protein
LPSPSWGYLRSSRGEHERTTAKDVTAAATTAVASDEAEVGTPPDADGDNGLPDPTRCVTLDGNRTNRNAVATMPTPPQIPRSNPVAGTDDRKNPQELWLGAGPRVTRVAAAERERSSQPRAVRTASVRKSAADNAATVPDGDTGPPRSTARSGSPASVASVGHPGGKTHYSNGSGVGWAETTARSL